MVDPITQHMWSLSALLVIDACRRWWWNIQCQARRKYGNDRTL